MGITGISRLPDFTTRTSKCPLSDDAPGQCRCQKRRTEASMAIRRVCTSDLQHEAHATSTQLNQALYGKPKTQGISYPHGKILRVIEPNTTQIILPLGT